MARTRTTVTLDEDVLKAVKIRAARTGRRESEVIEGALREALLVSPLEDLRDHTEQMSESEAIALALEAQAWAREERAKEARRASP